MTPNHSIHTNRRPAKQHRIAVWARGCVRRGGPQPFALKEGCSAWDVIEAAGGLGQGPYSPSGIIFIRSKRKKDGLYFRRRSIDIRKVDPRSVILRDGDNVIVQFDVTSAEQNSKPGK
jgi:hypothetical protein